MCVIRDTFIYEPVPQIRQRKEVCVILAFVPQRELDCYRYSINAYVNCALALNELDSSIRDKRNMKRHCR